MCTVVRPSVRWLALRLRRSGHAVHCSDLEEGESQGLPVWSGHVGDRILESNITRRVDVPLAIHAVNDYHPGYGDRRTSPIRRP